MAKFKKITYYEVFAGTEAGKFTVIGDGVQENNISKEELLKSYQPASNDGRELVGMPPVKRERSSTPEAAEPVTDATRLPLGDTAQATPGIPGEG